MIKHKLVKRETQIREYSVPFKYYKIENFLDTKNHSGISKIFENLSFYSKHTDLFKFHQTNELNREKKLAFFVKELISLAERILKIEIESVDLFASYYFKNNYLLCHDDMIEDRKYAFSYYISDFESGELAFYNEYADQEVVRLKVQGNLLVIFEVSEISFHEVLCTTKDGRKAFTGWFHYKGDIREARKPKTRSYNKIKHENNQIINLTSKILDFNTTFEYKIDFEISDEVSHEQGPFYKRRVCIVKGSNIEFSIEGLKLVSKNSYRLRIADYILLNDDINEMEGDLFDIFYFRKINDDDFSVVSYVDEEGEVIKNVFCIDSQLTFIPRKGNKIFIERMENECLLEHHIYIKA